MVKWNSIICAKKGGGLGIRNLKIQSKALKNEVDVEVHQRKPHTVGKSDYKSNMNKRIDG